MPTRSDHRATTLTEASHGRPPGYGRAVLSGGLAVGSVSGVRYAFGACIPAIASGLGVSLGAIAAAVTLHWVTFTVTAPVAWRVFARIGAPRMIVIGGVLAFVGMALSAVSPNATLVVLSFGVFVGLGTHGFGQMTAGAPFVGAPPEVRDRSLGQIASAAPVGTAIYPAIAALLVAAQGWRLTLAVIGVIVLALTLASGGLLRGTRPTPPAPTAISGSRTGTVWRSGTFLLLAAGFLITLATQTAVPFLMPIWALEIDVDAEHLATAFVILGVSGLLGRLLLTSATGWFPLRLWVTIPAAVLAVSGCLVAVLTKAAGGMYLAAALLGMSTPVFGALFAIAALACFPASLYPRVTGSILVPIGVGAGLAPLLMSAIIESQQATTLIWLGIAALIPVATGLFIAAEASSPERRTRAESPTAPLGLAPGDD